MRETVHRLNTVEESRLMEATVTTENNKSEDEEEKDEEFDDVSLVHTNRPILSCFLIFLYCNNL